MTPTFLNYNFAPII